MVKTAHNLFKTYVAYVDLFWKNTSALKQQKRQCWKRPNVKKVHELTEAPDTEELKKKKKKVQFHHLED